ncbi:MAG: squalene/phytoene synthase family protein [Plectolyngbya sp. WJT66-NPBG17]|jgi:phytoene synthase|nr:squalene/phytoene synthase family protein [Plectolyngbya sp. WJT66-NPBG17]MBW4524881.1 squalene/phytoene synthase family protein [Phormidium tanganyikae FI6-MK23]
MNTSVAELFGSSHYRAIADDALKDEDNAAWVMELESEIRQAWIERIRWIRLADRLAESDLVGGGTKQFQDFYAAWRWLSATGKVQPAGVYRSLFESMRQCWFDQPDQSCQLSQQSWERYLVALDRYSQKNLFFETIDAFETMLRELASPFFQVLPFLSTQTWQVVGAFGVVDQFYNTLRDLREDAEQGVCYLPTELLDRFGVTRREMLELRAYENPGYRSMMEFWIYDYLPKLHRRAYPFILSPDLHPSWQILRDWSLNRYRRIERVMRHCDYDYVRFPEVYWRQVQRDLVLLLPSRWGNATAPNPSGKMVSFVDRRCKLRKFVALDSQCG